MTLRVTKKPTLDAPSFKKALDKTIPYLTSQNSQKTYLPLNKGILGPVFNITSRLIVLLRKKD